MPRGPQRAYLHICRGDGPVLLCPSGLTSHSQSDLKRQELKEAMERAVPWIFTRATTFGTLLTKAVAPRTAKRRCGIRTFANHADLYRSNC